MSILNLDFFIFLTIVLIVYYLFPGKHKWIWLSLASAFYFCFDTVWYQIAAYFVFLIINYAMTLFMGEDQKYRKPVFVSILIFDILAFMLLKYPVFIYLVFSTVFGWFNISIDSPAISHAIAFFTELCPPHISYFGVIVIGYMCDVYWGKIKPQKNIVKYYLFTSFFPIMTSGPIITYAGMDNELFNKEHKFSYDRLVSGAERIIWGAFKKLVIAGRCAVIVDAIYSDYVTYNGLYIPFAAAMFAAQLYSDFSGLMDIVIGTAELFGITLPENFNLPFSSTSLSEFWRRWHITLGEWLKNYVLFPMYRSRAFKKLNKWCKEKWGKNYNKRFDLPSYISLFVSWFIIGLWHGGGINYIFGVGLYMWAVIVISDICKPYYKKITGFLHINTECFSYTLFQRVRTFIIFAFGLSFFRAANLTEGFRMWKNAFVTFNPWIFVNRTIYELGLDKLEWEILFIGILTVAVVSIFQKDGSVREKLNNQNFVFRLFLYLVLFMATVIFGYYGSGYDAASFIYGRF